MEIVLKTDGEKMKFESGQYAFVQFDDPHLDKEPHPFSFSNANNGPYVRFTIKALGDDTKKFNGSLSHGTRVFLEGPYGEFSYKKVANNKQVWIAGGIGITPFLSMARSFSETKMYDIRFYYGTESLEDAVFLNEFIDIMRLLPDNFNTKVVAKNFSGFISIETLKKSLENLNDFDYMICGPPVMMKTIRKQLIDSGVRKEQIHFEAFSM